MHFTIWSFRPRDECRRRFEEAYGPHGDWAKLFRVSPDYLGTTLLRDAADSERFVTVDRWRSSAAYDAFVAGHRDAYAALDRACDDLTETEEFVGRFDELS